MTDNPKPPKNERGDWVEEIEVAGNEVVSRVKELIQEGNVRRLIIRRSDGNVLMEVPLTASVVAGSAMLVFAPLFAALGALAAFLAEVRIEVVRMSDEEVEKRKNAQGNDTNSKQRIDIE